METLATPPKNPLFEGAVLRKVNELVAAINSGGGGSGSGTLEIGGLNSGNLNTSQAVIGGLNSASI
jgi:hypothetical protein